MMMLLPSVSLFPIHSRSVSMTLALALSGVRYVYDNGTHLSLGRDE